MARFGPTDFEFDLIDPLLRDRLRRCAGDDCRVFTASSGCLAQARTGADPSAPGPRLMNAPPDACCGHLDVGEEVGVVFLLSGGVSPVMLEYPRLGTTLRLPVEPASARTIGKIGSCNRAPARIASSITATASSGQRSTATGRSPGHCGCGCATAATRSILGARDGVQLRVHPFVRPIRRPR